MLRLVVVVLAAIGPIPLMRAQTFKVLYTFTGGADGAYPNGVLTQDSQGNLYGTTLNGGTANFGTVFKLDTTSGKESVLYSFKGGSDGAYPTGGVIHDAMGNLYGAASAGLGSIFKVDANGNESVLFNFPGGAEGGPPAGGVIRDANGNLYGMAYSGVSGNGVVYKLDTNGKETVLHSFAGFPTDGSFPVAGVIRDAKGNIYGATGYGGSFRDGVIFKLVKAAKETVLHRFTGARDGGQPSSGLIRDRAGNLYGTTSAGGSGPCGGLGCGVLFKRIYTGKQTVLYSFTGGADGSWPRGGLVLDQAGNLYGVAQSGGASNCGTVFKVDATGKFSVLYTFTCGTDGGNLQSGLGRDAAGNLYGVSFFGGSNFGTVFKITP